jgi:hypothetical protein
MINDIKAMVMNRTKVLLAALAIVFGGFGAAVIIVICTVRPGISQQPAIQIVTPSSGTRVAPGATITIGVAVGPGVTVSQMMILAQNPIGLSDALTAPPFQFPITIPTNIKAGQYHVTADATGAQGQDLQSASIVLDVEPSGSISGMRIQPGIITFRFVGDTLPVRVVGTLTAGGQVDLTDSSLITYTSGNTSIATVSTTGVVTAIGPGNTSITVSGPAAPFAIPVLVPSSIRGDLNGDGSVDLDDLHIIENALNTPATKPADARDLNGDGVINALDTRILVTLCTRPACATH